MSEAKPEVRPVKLICGAMCAPQVDLKTVEGRLERAFGPVDLRSDPFEFKFTDYYDDEMGSGLSKMFYSFEDLIMPDRLAAIKNRTIEIEFEFSRDLRRTVNLDPGYLEESKLVLASTKNFSHRIYLGDHIWGEVTLRYEKGEFVTHPWTYADYKTPLAFSFLKTARDLYRKQLASI